MWEKNIETTDAIEEEVKGIGADFGVQEDNVVIITEYLLANYIDPTALFGIVCIVLVVVMAGGTDDLQHLLCIYGAEDPGIWKIKGYGRYKAADPADCIPGGTLVTAIDLPLDFWWEA